MWHWVQFVNEFWKILGRRGRKGWCARTQDIIEILLCFLLGKGWKACIMFKINPRLWFLCFYMESDFVVGHNTSVQFLSPCLYYQVSFGNPTPGGLQSRGHKEPLGEDKQVLLAAPLDY